ncbi:hypothetical protein ACRALDRAFT_205166 [Sodiomyces alcalophilus JCM 7366]|uniref:uncharacterized protein n=1 Tax=Sodiomyces alcalophilus JCM 7366 TaxID=591952 RepID=UPI0039B3886A
MAWTDSLAWQPGKPHEGNQETSLSTVPRRTRLVTITTQITTQYHHPISQWQAGHNYPRSSVSWSLMPSATRAALFDLNVIAYRFTHPSAGNGSLHSSLEPFGDRNERRRTYVRELAVRGQVIHKRIRNDDIFFNALTRLLGILSTWTRHDEAGVTLDLGACSPHQGEVVFERFGFRLRHWPWRTDLARGGQRRRQIDFPKVEVITNLRIRQNSEILSPDILSSLMGQSLPNLRWFRHEKEMHEDPPPEMVFESEYVALLKNHLPRTLRHLSIFEDSADSARRRTVPTSTRLGAAFGRLPLTCPIQTLCVSFIIDAFDFFYPLAKLQITRTCRDLEYLALTSPLLSPHKDQDGVRDLLTAAGMAVLRRMPDLRFMELWNGARGYSCVFRYQSHWRRTEISLIISWDVDLRTVWATWDRLVEETRPQQPLHVTVTRVPRENVLGWEDVLDGLELVEDIEAGLVRIVSIHVENYAAEDEDDTCMESTASEGIAWR